MNIRNVSYNKRVAVKIRSARRPLIMGRRDGAEFVVKWMGFGNV
jgi:hypothetical protein